jgi:CRISPR-associated protein Csd1
MILQALKEYYDRKAADPDSEIAPPGFEWKEIPILLVLKADGTPISLEPTHESGRAKSYLVPQAAKRTVGVEANLFWDNPEYVLGVVLKSKKRSGKKTEDGIKKRVSAQHAAFIKRIDDLGDIDDIGVQAIKLFLQMGKKIVLLKALGEPWTKLSNEGSNLSFKLAGDSCLILERPPVKLAIQSAIAKTNDDQITCLVTGQKDVIELLHPPIRRIFGGKTETNIVSFNLDPFKSFGKDQGANAPIGKTAAFAYTTALNHLLGKGSKQRMQVGDASTVFWAEKANSFEHQVADFFSEPPKNDPDRGVRAVESLFRSIETGAFLIDGNGKNRFYVLGLSPNASRIAIRFWIVASILEMAHTICQHFKDTEVVPSRDHSNWPRWHSLSALLSATANETKYDKSKHNLVYYRGKYFDVKPNLAGETMRAILEGLPYPQTLLQAAVRRIGAEHEITYPRAAIIKACINRATRFRTPNMKEELKMSLDESNTNIGYRLGRLFAALEKIQQEANPGINTTIRDRFYGAASGTPVTVFGNLMRLKNHHLAKLERPGRRVFFQKLIGQIIDGVDAKIAFPAHLTLEDQGRFAIGYYHQMQVFFVHKNDNNGQSK